MRSKPEWGGGGLLDIGCYPITMSRFMFGAEPLRVSGVLERDPDFGTDRLASGDSGICRRAIDFHLRHADSFRTSACNFWERRGALRLRFRLTRRSTRPDTNFYR